MSENLELFVFMGKKVRVVNRDGEAWFVANDVGKVLGLTNIRDTIRKVLDANEWSYVTKFYGGNISAETPVENCYTSVKLPVENFYTSGKKNTKLVAINESGLYTLIMRSTRPEAKAFRKWVTGEVLPSIKNTGSYSMTANRQTDTEKEIFISKTPADTKSTAHDFSFSEHLNFTANGVIVDVALSANTYPEALRLHGITTDFIASVHHVLSA